MARQEINQSQIKNNDITGADINYQLGIYDETYSYVVGDKCFWGSRIYIAIKDVVPTDEGDLSNNPALDTDNWELLQRSAYSKVDESGFSGNPKKAVVEFDKPFKDVNYSIQISSNVERVWSFESKSTNGFTINSNANQAFTGEVNWSATQFGEF